MKFKKTKAQKMKEACVAVAKAMREDAKRERKQLEKAFADIDAIDIKIPTWKDKDGNTVMGIICPDSVLEDLRNWKPKIDGQRVQTKG